MPIVELRQYTLRPGQRDVLVNLFETEFIESQEAVGMKVLGQFHDLDRPDRFVWIRGFTDFGSRAEQLNAFYSGPVWLAHRDRANSTLIDSDNVLLLRAARPGSGLVGDDGPRPPRHSPGTPSGVVVAPLDSFNAPVGAPCVAVVEDVARPQLATVGIEVLASFVTEPRTNNYPRLPVREHEHVFVWFSRFADAADHERRVTALAASRDWITVAETIGRQLSALPEVLRLQPTPRSLLH
jgi:hypothetical protein